MKTLLYISTAVPDISLRDLADIERTSINLNARDGLTGLFLFNRANFLQVLEGDAVLVDRCMERIIVDERHEGVVVLRDCPIQTREFPQWSMKAFNVPIVDLESLEAARKMLDGDVLVGMSDTVSAETRRYLTNFVALHGGRTSAQAAQNLRDAGWPGSEAACKGA